MAVKQFRHPEFQEKAYGERLFDYIHVFSTLNVISDIKLTNNFHFFYLKNVNINQSCLLKLISVFTQ